MKIPSKIRIGGQEIEISQPDKFEDSKLGRCCVASGHIRIAKTFDGLVQSESSKENTYWHEVVHAILDTMGEDELSNNEKFVCTFAGFLTECYHSMEENWKNEQEKKQESPD